MKRWPVHPELKKLRIYLLDKANRERIRELNAIRLRIKRIKG